MLSLISYDLFADIPNLNKCNKLCFTQMRNKFNHAIKNFATH